ncbi:hypothetical protein B0H19DRAFT_1368761 [Mycena capillaripes]|nr:hypothetical protein B0H19DRAFT_1368761 [Mycena capillaripes]
MGFTSYMDLKKKITKIDHNDVNHHNDIDHNAPHRPPAAATLKVGSPAPASRSSSSAPLSFLATCPPPQLSVLPAVLSPTRTAACTYRYARRRPNHPFPAPRTHPATLEQQQQCCGVRRALPCPSLIAFKQPKKQPPALPLRPLLLLLTSPSSTRYLSSPNPLMRNANANSTTGNAGNATFALARRDRWSPPRTGLGFLLPMRLRRLLRTCPRPHPHPPPLNLFALPSTSGVDTRARCG